MSITFRQLRDAINSLPESHLDDTATVELEFMDECYPVVDLRIADDEHDSLESGHPIIFVD